MGRRSADEGSIYKRKKDGLWVAQYLVDTPDGTTKRKYIYGKKRKDVTDKLAEVQKVDSKDGGLQVHRGFLQHPPQALCSRTPIPSEYEEVRLKGGAVA